MENKFWHFLWIVCQTDDPQEMSRHFFYEKKKMLSAKHFAWNLNY